MLASLIFLTPTAAAVAAAALLPIGAFILAERRVATVRRRLALLPPHGRSDVLSLATLASVVLALALAAAQPALSTTETKRVRNDAQVLFVVDVSQSMAASSGRNGSTRLDRATAAAMRLRASAPELPAGVATLTDRVTPNLLPVPDAAAFDATMRQAVAINTPPPRELNVRATNFAALAEIPKSGYFESFAKHRAVVLLTDGESDFFDVAAVARALAAAPRTRLLAVQLWRSDETIYKSSGKPDPNYRPDPAGTTELANLAAATHGRVFKEGDLGKAAAALRVMLGTGPTRLVGRTRATHPLAPYAALFALLPLSLVFRRNARGRRGHARAGAHALDS